MARTTRTTPTFNGMAKRKGRFRLSRLRERTFDQLAQLADNEATDILDEHISTIPHFPLSFTEINA